MDYKFVNFDKNPFTGTTDGCVKNPVDARKKDKMIIISDSSSNASIAKVYENSNISKKQPSKQFFGILNDNGTSSNPRIDGNFYKTDKTEFDVTIDNLSGELVIVNADRNAIQINLTYNGKSIGNSVYNIQGCGVHNTIINCVTGKERIGFKNEFNGFKLMGDAEYVVTSVPISVVPMKSFNVKTLQLSGRNEANIKPNLKKSLMFGFGRDDKNLLGEQMPSSTNCGKLNVTNFLFERVEFELDGSLNLEFDKDFLSVENVNVVSPMYTDYTFIKQIVDLDVVDRLLDISKNKKPTFFIGNLYSGDSFDRLNDERFQMINGSKHDITIVGLDVNLVSDNGGACGAYLTNGTNKNATIIDDKFFKKSGDLDADGRLIILGCVENYQSTKSAIEYYSKIIKKMDTANGYVFHPNAPAKTFRNVDISEKLVDKSDSVYALRMVHMLINLLTMMDVNKPLVIADLYKLFSEIFTFSEHLHKSNPNEHEIIQMIKSAYKNQWSK